MAFQGDGTGKAIFLSFSPSGDFRIITPPIIYNASSLQFLTRRTSNVNDFIGTDTGGRVRARVGGVPLPDLTVTGLVDGGTIPSITLSKISGALTLSVSTQNTSAVADGNIVIFQEFMTNFLGVIDGGDFSFEDLADNSNDRSFDFSATSGSEIIDLNGNGNATLSGFTTGGFVANSTLATTSDLVIDTTNSLPASGNFQYYIHKVSDKTVFQEGLAAFTNGTATIQLPIDDFPVGTSVDWQIIDAVNSLEAGARQNTVTS